jgi:2-aminobenzoate-CoA ligase
MHFHRDVLAICDCFPRSVLQSGGRYLHRHAAAGLYLRPGRPAAVPLRVGATAVLLEN